jgi:hypothetical protein
MSQRGPVEFQVQALDAKGRLVAFARFESHPGRAIEEADRLLARHGDAWFEAGMVEIQIVTVLDPNWIAPRAAVPHTSLDLHHP